MKKIKFVYDLMKASIAGFVIYGIGRADFEDGLRLWIQSEVRKDLQRVCTIPEVNLFGYKGTGHGHNGSV